MTDSVCFKCGNRKHGAWVACPACRVLPANDDEAVVSLALTDHYQDEVSLGAYALQIMSGQPLHLAPEARAQLLAQMHAMPEYRSLIGALARAASRRDAQGTETSFKKPWWKPW